MSGENFGEFMPIVQVWELSKAWYHDRMNLDFRGRTRADVSEIFENLGLTSDFWKV